ncbi:succinyl-CoA synthetase subunit alpha [Sclerotinia borealis F-4128]|uniref:Succinyl-CoA synthetase subunit alpha n=1 Tax=Sclerotinia borealis (strain F-4128) TaxID=1432307 RepID=W9C9V0_SCLBF|nr:succinyl-CoA synthetase subunit alpha [Sclerotinia borealis F-4128]
MIRSKALSGVNLEVPARGLWGRQPLNKATANAKESIQWGTNIVGGVTPGKTGKHLGLPVLPTAMEKLKPDATGIYVAAHQAASAIEEAIEAEVPLIVAVAEHIPIHDMLRIHSILDTQSKCRLVGANSPGIISANGKCRIGFQPLSCFTPGCIGIVAKSGTLSYEAVASTTRAGLGQSLCIGMGGDILAGTNFVDALKVFEYDDETEGIIIIGEIGGEAELEAAAWIEEYKKRWINPKPIVALVAGICAAPGKVMGHAGAFTLLGEPDALIKIKTFEIVGVTMVNHPAKFGDAMKGLLRNSGRLGSGLATNSASQKRGIHTLRVRPTSRASTVDITQKRTVYIKEEDALKLLDERKIRHIETISKEESFHKTLTIGIDRSNRCPCVIIQSPVGKSRSPAKAKKFPFPYNSGPRFYTLKKCVQNLMMWHQAKSCKQVISSLFELFKEKEAFILETTIITNNSHDVKSQPVISNANFGFDDAAFKSAHRQSDIHSLPRADIQDAAEVEAAKHGIVYIKFAGNGNIGTLVNGAGLAMNTVDALAEAGGTAANFLDTGGKATAETVKRGFEAILGDERVKVIFVNIFGGLTLGDMIAEGVLLAYKELGVTVPVVVRIRGTNEKEGQRIIAESGLPLYSYDDFDEAAAKVIELANSSGE